MPNRIWDKEGKFLDGFLREYQHWVLELSYRQHTLGSFIIFAKRSVESISELHREEIEELPQVIRDMEGALSRAFRPERFNYLQMGNQLHHLHFHGIPRYEGPREFEGKSLVDAAYGKPPKWSYEDVEPGLVRKLREVIFPYLPI